MKIETLYNLSANLQNDKLSLLYQGNFSDDITDRIIDLSETSLSGQTDLQKIGKKVSLLLAECFQNIVRHGDFNHESKSAGIFVTRNIGNTYYISSANLIHNKDIDGLKEKIEMLNQLSAEELKQLYLEVLTNNQRTNRGGAGLGLIEMARKSGQKLEYDFELVDNEHSYFYLQIKLKAPSANDTVETIPIGIAKDFHRIMADDNIFLIHKGDFSSHTIIPILRMIEDNLSYQNESAKNKKKLVHVLIEILQNISKHGYVENDIREGIFLMGRRYNHFLVYAGNYIENSKVLNFRNYLNYLNRLNRNELLDVYKKTLNSGIVSASGSSGLGFLNIAKDSLHKLDFSFHQVDATKSFFGLGVVI
ncbi:MAG: SiaB family protein kinase [Bacteroidales bacterium]|nr:SiaB family protein kinase [Bacteroidales bacterium]